MTHEKTAWCPCSDEQITRTTVEREASSQRLTKNLLSSPLQSRSTRSHVVFSFSVVNIIIIFPLCLCPDFFFLFFFPRSLKVSFALPSIHPRSLHSDSKSGCYIGPLAYPLTRSLAPHCSLRSRAPLRSLVRSPTHSLAPELVGKWNIFVPFSKCAESLCTRVFFLFAHAISCSKESVRCFAQPSIVGGLYVTCDAAHGIFVLCLCLILRPRVFCVQLQHAIVHTCMPAYT